MTSLYIANEFPREDNGEGGVRRVVEAQRRYLPALGFDIVDDPREAEIIVGHSGAWVPRSVNRWAVRVFHCHGLYWSEYQWGKWAQERNHKLIEVARQADLTIADSEWVANTLRRDLLLDAKVVYNGIDLPKTTGRKPTPSDYVLWNKARVDPVCEVDTLGLLVKRMPDVEFVSTFAPKTYMDIAAKQGGDGPWQVADNFRLTGKLPYTDALGWVKRAGVYLATTREAFSVGVLEAMSWGVPVVGYDWGGTREAVIHKSDGWLAAPGDVDGLAAGIEYVRTHRSEMSAAAAEHVRASFTWEVQMARCANYYFAALEQYRREGKPRVSVIIPCHNMERFVGQAVVSALDQKVAGGHEVIVVDDASTDGSADIVQSFKPVEVGTGKYGPLMVDHLPKNVYLADALNTGIKAARGEYILNLDADNLLPEGSLARLVKALDNDDAGDVAYGRVQFIDEDGSPQRTIDWPPAKFDYAKLMGHLSQVQSSAMFRRRVWERLGGYRQHHGVGGVRLNSDADFWCRAATAGFRFARVTNEPTLVYRQRKESMSRTVPDYDWTAWCPKEEIGARVPMGVSGKPSTLDPTVVSVIVRVESDADAQVVWRSVESLWPQTLDNWECLVVWGHVGDGLHYPLPPYVKLVGSLDEALRRARGSHIVPLAAGEYLHPDALSRLVGAIQWSEREFREDDRQRFAYSDWLDPDTGKSQRATDTHIGALLVPRSLARQIGSLGAGTQHCGQYVEGPLLIVAGRHVSRDTRGETTLAGCGCGGAKRSAPGSARGCIGPGCSGARVGASSPVQRVAARDARLVSREGSTVKPDAPMTLVQYIGGSSSRTFRVNGNTYLFGLDRGHRAKYVFTSDLPTLLNTRQIQVVEQAGSDVTPQAEPELAAVSG